MEEGDIFDDKDLFEIEFTVNLSKHAERLRLYGKFLHAAILSENCTPNTIREVVREHPTALNSVVAQLGTPLHYAISNEMSVEVIHELFLLGANVNMLSTSWKVSPLQSVFSSSCNFRYICDVVKLLISYGADPNLGGDLTPKNYRFALEAFIERLYSKSEENMAISVIHALLKSGAKIKSYTIFSRLGFFEMNNSFLKSEKLILLLEYNILPLQELWKDSSKFDHSEAKLVKLIMQYLVVQELSNNPVKIGKTKNN